MSQKPPNQNALINRSGPEIPFIAYTPTHYMDCPPWRLLYSFNQYDEGHCCEVRFGEPGPWRRMLTGLSEMKDDLIPLSDPERSHPEWVHPFLPLSIRPPLFPLDRAVSDTDDAAGPPQRFLPWQITLLMTVLCIAGIIAAASPTPGLVALPLALIACCCVILEVQYGNLPELGEAGHRYSRLTKIGRKTPTL